MSTIDSSEVIDSTNGALERELAVLGSQRKLTAANALRRDVLSTDSIFLLTQAGFPDKVIRVIPLKGKKINLDNGPQQEEWREVERQIYTMSRRDRPIPAPAPVAPSSNDEWSIRIEDVPTVVLLQQAEETAPVYAPAPAAPVSASPVEAAPAPAEPALEAKAEEAQPVLEKKELARVPCDQCGKMFTEGNGLKIHKTTRHRVRK